MVKALIVATGPSLTRDDIIRWSRGRTVYAVNDAYRIAPRVSFLYACDEEWIAIHDAHTRHIPQRWTTNKQAADRYGWQHIPGRHASVAGCHYDASGHGIIYGGNGGFQAFNLATAVHGHTDAVLLGFDYGHDIGEPKHFFGEHPSACDNPSPFRDWCEHWRRAMPEIEAAGVRVRNATPRTFLEAVPKVVLW